MSQIPGAPIFDGREAMKGCALNRMCYSFNAAANRAGVLEWTRRIDAPQ